MFVKATGQNLRVAGLQDWQSRQSGRKGSVSVEGNAARFMVVVRMWWPTGNSQLEGFGMNHRIVNLPTAVQEKWRKDSLPVFS